MIDYEDAREKMVDCQVRTVDVTDHAVLTAMLDVPREAFVPEKLASLAYIDQEVSMAGFGAPGRYLLTPAHVGKLLQAADVKDTDVVLVVGAASGYTAALLSRLASSIVALEEVEQLADTAKKALSENGFDNVAVLNAEMKQGYVKVAPYDIIFIEGAVDEVPETLFDQLAEKGRLIAVVGHGHSGKAMVYGKNGGIVSGRLVMNCAAKAIPGFEKHMEFSL